MLTPGGDPFLHAPPRIQDGNCFSISSNMLDVEGDYRAPTGQPEFGSVLDKANRTDTTNPALGIDYDDITIAPAPAPAAAAAAPSYGRTSAPPIHAPVPISPPCNPLISSFSSKIRPRLSNVLWPVSSRPAQAPGCWPSLSRSPGKWLGWPISSWSCALPGVSHLLFFFWH